MANQVAWGKRKPGVEEELLDLEAKTAAYYGQLGKARGFSRQAVASAMRVDEKGAAARFEASAALREALLGNRVEARQRVAAALALSKDWAQYDAAFVLSLVGDTTWPVRFAQELEDRSPEDTIVKVGMLPTLRAQLALDQNDAQKAIESLQVAAPYESGGVISLYPAFVRGQAYLATHQGSEATVEFQKILGHRGIVCNDPIGALAHLQLARAYILQGDTTKAKAAYQDFLTLWKDADPDIPILIAAKAEYSKLQ